MVSALAQPTGGALAVGRELVCIVEQIVPGIVELDRDIANDRMGIAHEVHVDLIDTGFCSARVCLVGRRKARKR